MKIQTKEQIGLYLMILGALGGVYFLIGLIVVGFKPYLMIGPAMGGFSLLGSILRFPKK